MKLLDTIRDTVRGIMAEVAMFINESSHGRIKPNHITLASVLGHFVIALAIIYGQFASAALLLAVFGILDTVDGELARAQAAESDRGMLADSAGDRLKEVILYSAVAYYFADINQPLLVLMSVVALGGSMLTSYIKAKSEVVAALKDNQQSVSGLNRLPAGGLFSFEVRVVILIIGLAVNELEITVTILAISTMLTALARFRHSWQTIK